MALPIPPARAVARPSWQRWLVAAILAIGSLAVPLAFVLVLPARDPWIRWAFVAIPVAAWAAALTPLLLRGESPWIVVDDPARRRDPRRWIYVVLDLLLTTGYLVFATRLAVNRHAWASALLELLPLGAWTMTVGTLMAWRRSWWLTVAGGALVLAWMIGAMIIVLYFASYLAGVYGGFGKAASLGALVSMALLVELIGLVPAFQLRWALGRAGRRAFGLAPLWQPPAAPAP
ncbi:MAG TPA: hypothetical protein VHE35_36655, partial [Kofleriaceae bacterium]|nr:hypothetical protein [Kofleriaceae bacterium]